MVSEKKANIEYHQIKEISNKLIGNILFSLDKNYSKNLENLIISVGGKITFKQDFSPASITIYNEHNFEINLQQFSTPLNDYFKLAWAFGHYFMHCNFSKEPEKSLTIYLSGNEEKNIQARRFAAELTMPEEIFKELLNKNLSLDKISSYFQVPEEVVKIRAEYCKNNFIF